ncbi:MAG: hypothetical protein RIS09_1263 [Actinomycetota bacterium]
MLGALGRLGISALPLMNYQSLLLINLVGAFTLGFILRFTLSRSLELFLATGLLGGFTTTSALMTTLTEFEQTPLAALAYLAISFYGGWVLFFLARRMKSYA